METIETINGIEFSVPENHSKPALPFRYTGSFGLWDSAEETYKLVIDASRIIWFSRNKVITTNRKFNSNGDEVNDDDIVDIDSKPDNVVIRKALEPNFTLEQILDLIKEIGEKEKIKNNILAALSKDRSLTKKYIVTKNRDAHGLEKNYLLQNVHGRDYHFYDLTKLSHKERIEMFSGKTKTKPNCFSFNKEKKIENT